MELFAWLGAPLETAYSILASLNLAERHGDRSMLINSYAAVGFLLSLTPLTKLAEHYIARGRALLTYAIDPLREVGFYRASLAAAINLGAVHRIDPADLPRAMLLSQQLGDLYAQMFLLTVQTQLEWLAGADAAARASLQTLIEMARRSDHVMELVVGRMLEAVQTLQQGRHAEAVAALNELSLHAHREGLEGYIQLSDALRALCLMREGETVRAREVADRALAVLAVAPITTSMSACCVPALVETYLELWRHASTVTQREALAPQIRRSLQALRRVAATVRIAGPSSLLLEGRYHWLRGEVKSAERCFGKSQALAEELGLLRDAARAAAWLGRATSGPAGRDLVEAAHRRMAALGAKWDAEHTQKWLLP